MDSELGDRSSFIVGIIENRAKEVGLAAFDLRTAALHLSQFIETSRSYQNTKTLLHYYDPTDIIVTPFKMASEGMAGVSALVDSSYSLINKVIMARGCFDDTKGAIMVKSLAAKEPSALILDTYSKQYYLCLAAAAACIKWVESEKGISITNHSLLVTFNGSFDHMNIDVTSSRLLRANLLQPLKDIETINARLDCLLNSRNKSAAEECYLRTKCCLEGLIDSVQQDISLLTLLSESLCLLDMIVNSFAHTILSKPVDNYTRPEFTENGPIAIEAGRHPILECIRPEEFVANNTFLSEASNMVIVMGPNMSGKSTYLRQVCLMAVFAQIGCYVPAHFASFRVVDRLFTRIGTGDSLESNSSTVYNIRNTHGAPFRTSKYLSKCQSLSFSSQC